mgnify:CR=1 FL=1
MESQEKEVKNIYKFYFQLDNALWGILFFWLLLRAFGAI